MKKDNFKLESTNEIFTLVENLVATTATETQKLLERTTEQIGHNLKSVAENPLLKTLSDFLGTEWLMAILGEIDIEQAQAKVRKLKEKYPQKKPDQLAHQIMLDKAWQAGRIGLVTNIIPPVAAVLLGIELAATAKLQAEMVYEIAGAYGLDLDEPARRGEVLAIFGLSLGTGLLKAGTSLVEIIPGVGAVIGASTNAVMLYALGYTACQFYQGKYNSFSSRLTTETWQQEREDYWRGALAQSRIMDQVLVHMVLASYPEQQSWSEILRALGRVIN